MMRVEITLSYLNSHLLHPQHPCLYKIPHLLLEMAGNKVIKSNLLPGVMKMNLLICKCFIFTLFLCLSLASSSQRTMHQKPTNPRSAMVVPKSPSQEMSKMRDYEKLQSMDAIKYLNNAKKPALRNTNQLVRSNFSLRFFSPLLSPFRSFWSFCSRKLFCGPSSVPALRFPNQSIA